MMRTFAFLLLGLASLHAAEAPKDEQLRLAGSVHVIFERKCNECHGSQLKKPEGKFGYVLDLKRIADNEDYVVRGKPKDSDLFRMVRDEEMPPDDHPKTPPLTAHEKDIVRRWINIGAPHELPAVLPTLPEEKTAIPSPAAAISAKDRATKKNITLSFKQKPAGEVFAEVAKQSGITVTYTAPAQHEPQLSIQLKNGSTFDALTYLALCGNFPLTFTNDAAVIGPNPPIAKKGDK